MWRLLHIAQLQHITAPSTEDTPNYEMTLLHELHNTINPESRNISLLDMKAISPQTYTFTEGNADSYSLPSGFMRQYFKIG